MARHTFFSQRRLRIAKFNILGSIGQVIFKPFVCYTTNTIISSFLKKNFVTYHSKSFGEITQSSQGIFGISFITSVSTVIKQMHNWTYSRERNPYWCLYRIVFALKNYINLSYIIFSNGLEKPGSKLIRRYLFSLST